MTLRKDALKAISDWTEAEFGTSKEWEFDETGELIAGDPLNDIGFCYSQYDNVIDYEHIVVDEQWVINLEGLKVYLYLDTERVLTEGFGDYGELVEWLEGSEFDELIGIADDYINEHWEEHREDWAVS